MAEKRYYVRRDDGSGAGAVFKTAEEADRWVKANSGYVRESDEQRESNQQEADAEVAAKAQEQAEDKAARAPRRNG